MSDTTIISGLHTCKPKNAPTVGQVKAFILEDRGDWTKVRNPDGKKNEVGHFYRILKAERTNYSDAHGNISFNLELEESAAPPQQQAAPQGHPSAQPNASAGAAPPANGNGGNGQDTAEQYLMRSANLYCAALKLSSTVIRDAAHRMGLELSVEDIRQIATHLSMGAQYAGYISHMSDREQRPAQRKDPY